MFDDAPFMLAELAKRMADEPHFGVCFDIAHAFISGSPVEDWYNVVSPYVKHIHANDNDGVEDLHNPVGEGRLEWDVFDSWCRGFKDKPSLLVEVRSFEDLEKSVKYMQEHNIYPFG